MTYLNHIVERCYVMWRDMNCLFEDEGWKRRPEFKAYVNAIEKVPDLGNKNTLTELFFSQYRLFFPRDEEHVLQAHIEGSSFF